jgi:hypothetical protein
LEVLGSVYLRHVDDVASKENSLDGPAAAGQQVVFSEPQCGNQLVMFTSSVVSLDVKLDFSANPR